MFSGSEDLNYNISFVYLINLCMSIITYDPPLFYHRTQTFIINSFGPFRKKYSIVNSTLYFLLFGDFTSRFLFLLKESWSSHTYCWTVSFLYTIIFGHIELGLLLNPFYHTLLYPSMDFNDLTR